MEKRRVVITGLGTVNPLGNNVADSWAAARAGKCGIGPITQFDTTDFKCKLAGEVKDFDPETVVDKKEVRKMARFTLLALGAAAEAIADSGLDTEAEGKDIGVILSSGIGGLPTIEEQHARGEEKGMEKVSPYFVPMAIANMAAAQVAIRFGLKGMCTCPVTACAGGTNAVGDAFHRIRDGYEPVMVCGGAESCISPLGIGGFTSMKALSTATDPDAASLPFDARRGGFVMGEGSGVLVLEELEHARARGAHIYAEVVGYGANCDAYHFTAPAGEVKDFDPETVVDKKEVRKMARFTLLALGAAAEAIADSGLDTEAEGKDIGVILSSGIGGLPTIEEQHARGEEKGMEKVSPYFVPMAIANMAAAQVAIRFGLKGMCTCPVTACAGGTNAVGDAFHRIRDGYEPVMVCGGAESCISPLGIGGFTSMKALSTATDPDAASLPFDARRGGFVMGEGSGVLVLEELEHARARGAHIYAEVVGYGANCDAYHFTAPAPGGAGAIDCMKLTLVDADIAPEQVDHINAHGTGTHMNDACETAAIHAVFGAHAKEMTVVSTKSMTGHLLGGAGGIEAVFTALALRDQFAPPTIHYAQPDPECDLDYVPNTGRQQEMQYALSNSLGFGGHNACIALRRWEG